MRTTADARGWSGGRPSGAGRHRFVVVASRLPVDRTEGPDGEMQWRTSPGGLVSALEPVMRQARGVWIGWSGDAGPAPGPFEVNGLSLVGMGLSAEQVRDYYEGFCNATLWPLYHDVIAQPEFHRRWWEAYVTVNQSFAQAAVEQAAPGATVWVHDYQLQLVPQMVREQRSDVRIGFFNHIPFPGYEIFAQLPWRRQVISGLIGADLLGFQRRGDAANFLRACRRAAGLPTRGNTVRVGDSREIRAAAFPISIDSAALEQIARQDSVRKRADEIRQALGEPDTVLLGIDRLDYTKGIPHRLRAFGELLREDRLGPRTTLVQVASPSRERVGAYRALRDGVELAVSRINGEHAEVGSPPVHYLHQAYPREEMAALYLAADVMLVTSLRDGMNLVAKEYVACRYHESGALVLSEFTGAADELTGAFLVNPHDIEGLKDAIVRAVSVGPAEARRRMRLMRRPVREHDVAYWAESFLGTLVGMPAHAALSARSAGRSGQRLRVERAQRRPVPVGQRGVVGRVIGHREPVVPGVELDGVRDPGRGQRTLQQLGVLLRKSGVFDGARHVDRGADLVRRQVRAARVTGDGDPGRVERGRRGDLVPDGARRHHRHPPAHAVPGGADSPAADLRPGQQVVGVGGGVGGDPVVAEAAHQAEEPVPFLLVSERGDRVERRPGALAVEDIRDERDVPEAGEVVAHLAHGLPQPESIREQDHARPRPLSLGHVQRSVAHAVTSRDLYIDARHLGSSIGRSGPAGRS
jgi:trehalose 6-phosphate synthase